MLPALLAPRDVFDEAVEFHAGLRQRLYNLLRSALKVSTASLYVELGSNMMDWVTKNGVT